MQSSVENVRKILEEEHLDAFLVSTPSNISYLLTFFGFIGMEREAFVLVTKKSLYVFTSMIYLQAVKEKVKHATIIETTATKPFTEKLKTIAATEQIQRIGFEDTNLTVAELSRFSKVSVSFIPSSLHTIRKIKDSKEIGAIENACAIGDKAFSYIVEHIKLGITENELVFLLELFIRKQHAEIAFPTIIAFGRHAAVPHHASDQTKLENNQFVLMDFGVKWQGYCSDMTRTVFFGEPTDEDKNMYEAVKTAQEKAIEKITMLASKTNVEVAIIDKEARDYIEKSGYPSYPHSLGHGIGIDVHEMPSISVYSKDILEKNMVFSVEPGIYLEEQKGVRIEDLVVLEEKPRLLTHALRDFIVLS